MFSIRITRRGEQVKMGEAITGIVILVFTFLWLQYLFIPYIMKKAAKLKAKEGGNLKELTEYL